MTSQASDVRGGESRAPTRRSEDPTSGTGAGQWRRVASAVIGGALVLFGLRRRSFRGLIAAVAGGWLLYRGVGGGSGGSGSAWPDRPESTPGRVRTEKGASPAAVDVERSITVAADPDELYERWNDPDTHERIWGDFAEVTSAGEDRQHWRVEAPMGRTLEWGAEVTEKRPGEHLHWESLPGTTIPNEGTVWFSPESDTDDSEVTLQVRFDPPGGRVGTEAMRRLDVVPDAAAGTALRRFKSLVETGEIQTTDGNVSARGRGDLV